MNEIELMLFKLRRLLRSRGRSADDTDDLIQEAFLRLQLYCREHEVQKTEAFLIRTVLNLSTDMYKRQRSANAAALALETLEVGDFIPAADEVCASQERLLHMKTGLDQLSPRRREGTPEEVPADLVDQARRKSLSIEASCALSSTWSFS